MASFDFLRAIKIIGELISIVFEELNGKLLPALLPSRVKMVIGFSIFSDDAQMFRMVHMHRCTTQLAIHGI